MPSACTIWSIAKFNIGKSSYHEFLVHTNEWQVFHFVTRPWKFSSLRLDDTTSPGFDRSAYKDPEGDRRGHVRHYRRFHSRRDGWIETSKILIELLSFCCNCEPEVLTSVAETINSKSSEKAELLLLSFCADVRHMQFLAVYQIMAFSCRAF